MDNCPPEYFSKASCTSPLCTDFLGYSALSVSASSLSQTISLSFSYDFHIHSPKFLIQSMKLLPGLRPKKCATYIVLRPNSQPLHTIKQRFQILQEYIPDDTATHVFFGFHCLPVNIRPKAVHHIPVLPSSFQASYAVSML